MLYKKTDIAKPLWIAALILSLISIGIFSPAHAMETGANLIIRAKIIQCGKMENIDRACQDKPACCTFAERVSFDESFAHTTKAPLENEECAPGNLSGGKRGPVFCANLEQ